MRALGARLARLARRISRRLQRGRAWGALELPRPGSRVSPGRILIIGWAMPPTGVVGHIELRVQGRSAGAVRPLGVARPDVARKRKDASAPIAGFDHAVEVAGAPGERVDVELDVVDIEGNRSTITPLQLVLGEGPSAVAVDGLEESMPREARHRDGPVRLAVFTHRLDYGGGQLYLQDLLRQLVAAGDLEVHVFTGVDGPLRQELETLSMDVEVIDLPNGPLGRVEYEEAVAAAGSLVRTLDADVVLVNTMSAGVGADAGVRLGIPVIWAIHEHYTRPDYWAAAHGEGGLDQAVQARQEHALRSSAALVFEADATRVLVAGDGGSNAVTVRYGVDLSEIDAFRATHGRDEVRRSLGIDPDTVLLLCMGTFEPRKAQGSLALAFSELAHDHPRALLALVGATKTVYANAIREVADRLDLGAQLRVEGVVTDTYRWYLAADAVVSASDIESMPRSFLEAMAFEVPIVAAAAGGVDEVVADGRTGIVFAPRDVRVLRDALARVLELSAEERRRMGEAGRVVVEQQHPVHEYADAYRTLIRGLAADPSASPRELLSS